MSAKKREVVTRNLALTVLVFFALFGVLFVVGVVHELIHVIQGQGAQSICWDLNYKIDDEIQKGYLMFHTSFDINSYQNITEYYTWREWSEKCAGIITEMLYVVIGVLIGVLLTKLWVVYKE